MDNLTRFKRVADLGNITKASETLFITQPALTQAIHRLEKELGYNLFSQSGKRIFLTPQGKDFYQICSKIIELWGKGKSLEASKSYVQAYSIGLFDSAALILSEFLEKKSQNTNIELTIDRSKKILRNLNNGLLDFCICILLEDKSLYSNLVIVKTWEEKLIPVSKKVWKDIKKIPFIMHTKNSASQKYIDREFIKADIKPNVIMESANPMFTKDLALRNRGVAFLPESMVKKDIKEKKLVVQKLPMHISRTCAIFKSKQSYPKEKEDFLREIMARFN